MTWLGPSMTVSNSDSLVAWTCLLLLLSGFSWAMLRYRIPRTRAAKTLGVAADELKQRVRDTQGKTATRADGSQRTVTQQTATNEAARYKSQQEDIPKTERKNRSRLPRAFAREPRFSQRWERFTTAWIATRREQRGQAVGIASSADFFTRESVLSRTGGTIPDALPGVFTAVGLLGTFVGIAIGLAGIPEGGTGGAPSAEDLRLGIDTLMGGMSTAFSTSIVGISGSIWWIFEFRLAKGKLASSLADFVDVANRLFPVEQPQETLGHIATAMDGVKGGIQTLGQDMAGALEPLIEQHITKPIESLNLELGERQTNALERMAAEFRDTLVSHVGEELHRFGEAIKSARAHQLATLGEIEAFMLLLEEVSKTQLDVLDRGANVAATFDRGLSALTESEQAIERAGVAARQTMEEAEGVVGESRQQMEAQKEAAEALFASWTAQRDALDGLRTDLRALTSDLGDKILEFRSLAAEKIAEVFHSFDSEMGRVAEHLGGTLAELRETTEEFPGIATRLVDVTTRLEEAGRQQQESLTQGLEEFEKTAREIAARLDTGRTEFLQASESLPARAQEISNGMGGFVESIQNASAGLKRSADETIRSAGRATERLDSVSAKVAPMNEAMKNVRASIDELAQTMRAASQRWSDSGEQRREVGGITPPPERMDGDSGRTPTNAEPSRRRGRRAVAETRDDDQAPGVRSNDGLTLPTREQEESPREPAGDGAQGGRAVGEMPETTVEDRKVPPDTSSAPAEPRTAKRGIIRWLFRLPRRRSR